MLHETEYYDEVDLTMRSVTACTSDRKVLAKYYQSFYNFEKTATDRFKWQIPYGIDHWMEHYQTRMRLWSLKCFDGDPKDWPYFKWVYDWSNKEADFSDGENLRRLREFLKGKAKKEVNMLLDNAENVGRIIEILENKFGRIEMVFQVYYSQLANMKLSRDVNGDFRKFVLYCWNLVEAVESMENGHEYLKNSPLYLKVIQKIPLYVRLAWDKQVFEDSSKFFNPSELVYWLNEYAWQNVPKALSTKSTAECFYCQAKHYLSECKEFRQIDLKDRWKFAKDQKICIGCLNSKDHHVKECPETKICKIKFCEKKHHKLFHNNKNDYYEDDWWWAFPKWQQAFELEC